MSADDEGDDELGQRRLDEPADAEDFYRGGEEDEQDREGEDVEDRTIEANLEHEADGEAHVRDARRSHELGVVVDVIASDANSRDVRGEVV